MITFVQHDTPRDPKKTYFTKKSLMSGEHTAQFNMHPDEFKLRYDAWCAGMLVQKAFDVFSDDEREFIMTGYTPSDWDKMFPKDEESEY